MRLAITALTALAACGCVQRHRNQHVGGAATACRGGDPMVETMLFLGHGCGPVGRSRATSSSEFIETEVATRWKEGFTILEGQGLRGSPNSATSRNTSRATSSIRFH